MKEEGHAPTASRKDRGSLITSAPAHLLACALIRSRGSFLSQKGLVFEVRGLFTAVVLGSMGRGACLDLCATWTWFISINQSIYFIHDLTVSI